MLLCNHLPLNYNATAFLKKSATIKVYFIVVLQKSQVPPLIMRSHPLFITVMSKEWCPY